MAETEKAEQPQTNGLENGLDEDERSKLRPADIDADVREMERRKRVEMIMSSKLFREELERIIELQLKDGNGPAGLLQQISDMMGIQSGKLQTTHMFRGSNCVTPINDIRGVESMGYEKGEKNLRCKLASVFRLMDLYGWSQGINNQITARLNQDEEHFLVNPHGMLFNEITASSLVKVDMQGNIVEPGTTNFSVNTQGFLLHSAIHASRPDVNCVIHIKTPSVLAVSSLKCGLLPICQEALVIGEVSQHPFVSGIFEPEEREKIIRNLGPHNKVLLLHNHGAVCCGATVEEAFYNVYNTVLACETQMKLMPIGVENLLLVSDETRKQVYDAAHRAPDGGAAGDKKKFRVGEMEFEALIRMLDNAGFRTGYIYRHPLVKGELPKPKNDVEVPPAVSSLGYLIEQEELYKQGNWKKYIDGRNRLDRTKWLNSPNVYQKVEILETGTSDPKKITKWVDQNSEEWVAESSPTHSSTPVKIDSALQFVPKGTNPKEFKKLQQQIKENRRADKITSGPQSHILEGVSWEEAKKLQDANITQTGDQVILVGAASKGIIQRNYQHNALVYKTPYAKNPFDSMSDKEIEDYKQMVERKQRGDTDYEESQSESEAISSSRQDALRHFKSPLLSPQSATSETEEESRDEPRVLRIETKTAPRPIQAEVVLSDAESDTTDARIERSHSARYPKAEKPESVTLMNSFRKSWSLKREKDKSKDVENICDSRNLHPSFFLNDSERDRMESLHCCVARVKQLTHKPVVVDVSTKALRTLLKSASDPCNLSALHDEDEVTEVNRDADTSLSCGNISMTGLQQRLHARKILLHSAKMKFLGYSKPDREPEILKKAPTSPMCALISEIRETINEIMSPERSKTTADPVDSMEWIEGPKLVSRTCESECDVRETHKGSGRKASLNKSFAGLVGPPEDSEVAGLELENSEGSGTANCSCIMHGGHVIRNWSCKGKVDENQNEEMPSGKVGKEAVEGVVVNASDEDATYTVTDDSLLQTYSFTESTETEWYYNKTIMKLDNSQTMLEIKEMENKGDNVEMPIVRHTDTGIDTDFTSEKENESQENSNETEKQEKEAAERVGIVEDVDGEIPVCESSGLNKSSETDSSFLKSGSGRTSNDVDTSFAFKTETENSEKNGEKSPEKSVVANARVEEKKFLQEMLLKSKETIEEESSDSGEAQLSKGPQVGNEKEFRTSPTALSDIPESPEFTNVDTEDAPVTSSSKDTSPEMGVNSGRHTDDDPMDTTKDPEVDLEEEKENIRPEHKRKKNMKSSTKITVKKELKEKHTDEAVVSEIRLTIKNSKKCQSEKYEVKIQDVTDTCADLSGSVSSVGESGDSYESLEIVDKSCDCEAQLNLEELQSEVSSTIEKLHGIENYFEDEIRKHHSIEASDKKNGLDEFTIEYNYREFEEVLNESKDKTERNSVQWGTAEDGFLEGVSKGKGNEEEENVEFFVSTLLGDLCGNVEIVEVMEDADVGTETRPLPSESRMEDMAVSSAFVAAVLEAVLEEVNEGNSEEETVCVVQEPLGVAVAEEEEKVEKNMSEDMRNKSSDEVIEDVQMAEKEGVEERAGVRGREGWEQAEGKTAEQPSEDGVNTHQGSEEAIAGARSLEEGKWEQRSPTEGGSRQREEEGENCWTCSGEYEEAEMSGVGVGSKENPPESSTDSKDEAFCGKVIKYSQNGERESGEEVKGCRQEVMVYNPRLPYLFLKGVGSEGDVTHILNGLLNSVTKEDKMSSSVSDVMKFIVNNESPTDSLAEFEDMENIISTSSSMVAESQLEGEVDSLPDEEEPPKEAEKGRIDGRRRKREDAIFKVTVATSGKKEIFINYSPEYSSTFNTSADSEHGDGGELCNSYIKTDEVNEDFENMSSDNPDFYSVGSPEKNSVNSSFCSLEGNPVGESFCCCESNAMKKSPRALAIICEVDEGDSSISSEVAASGSNGENTINGDHSDAHQSTFSHSSKEGSPTKDRSMEDSPKKDKKKKKGLRTPSFLKKKKEKKKIVELS